MLDPTVDGSGGDSSISQAGNNRTLTEKFSGFKTGGKAYPPAFLLVERFESGKAASAVGSTELEWKMNFDQVFFNEQLGPGVFEVS